MCRKVVLSPDNGEAVTVSFSDTNGELRLLQGSSAVTIHPEEILTKDLFNAIRYVLGLKTK